MVETHLIDNCEHDNETSQEQIMPCQSIKDLSITYQIKHSGCKIDDSHRPILPFESRILIEDQKFDPTFFNDQS